VASLARASLLVGIGSLLAFVVPGLSGGEGGPLYAYRGLLQRAFLVPPYLWLAWVALTLAKDGGRLRATTG
jgi:hypothetical protein